MHGKIYILRDQAKLAPMIETQWDAEHKLQQLIADYPDLLGGDQIDVENHRRWLLVTREMPMQGEEPNTTRLSLDHLFLDQDGIPTLVEVKRGENAQVRREVVGQLLDYAAIANTSLNVRDIQEALRSNRTSAEVELKTFLGEDASVEEFWQRVQSNLDRGQLRLIVLADTIPAELRREWGKFVAEFLAVIILWVGRYRSTSMNAEFCKINEFMVQGQFRKLLTVNDQFVLVGGCAPITGPRNRFSAIACSVNAGTGELIWESTLEKSRPFVHAAIQGQSLFVSIPTNFTHSFTGLVCYEIGAGSLIRKYEREEVLLGCATLSEKLYFATGLHGEYGVHFIDDTQVKKIECDFEPGHLLKTICGNNTDILVTTSVDSQQEELEFVHTAFRPSGEYLWCIRTRKHNVDFAGERFVCWDDELRTLELFDSDNGKKTAEIELTAAPLEVPVFVGELGIVYSCADCTTRFRNWTGNEVVICRKPVSGTIAAVFDFKTNHFLIAASGNNRDTTTTVSTFSIK